MSPKLRPLLALLLLLGLLSSGPPPAASQTAVPRAAPSAAERARALDDLFGRLGKADGDAEAAAIVPEIWTLWLHSGRTDVDLLMGRAVAAMRSENQGLALVLLDEIVALAPDYAEGWNKRATVLWILGEHDRSLADIVETLQQEPRHFGALAGRAMILMGRQDWTGALAAYREAMRHNPFLHERHQIIPALERRVGGQKI